MTLLLTILTLTYWYEKLLHTQRIILNTDVTNSTAAFQSPSLGKKYETGEGEENIPRGHIVVFFLCYDHICIFTSGHGNIFEVSKEKNR